MEAPFQIGILNLIQINYGLHSIVLNFMWISYSLLFSNIPIICESFHLPSQMISFTSIHLDHHCTTLCYMSPLLWGHLFLPRGFSDSEALCICIWEMQKPSDWVWNLHRVEEGERMEKARAREWLLIFLRKDELFIRKQNQNWNAFLDSSRTCMARVVYGGIQMSGGT